MCEVETDFVKQTFMMYEELLIAKAVSCPVWTHFCYVENLNYQYKVHCFNF